MASLFVLMMAPVAGWYFLGDLASRELWSFLPPAQRAAVEAIQSETRLKLALVLAASLAILGAVVWYLRRDVLDPLERLAEQARTADSLAWRRPQEVDRPDEIGDLARSLDRAVDSLQRRAEDAVQFAQDLAHEVRTPLATVQGALELLAEPDLASEDRDRFVGHARREAQRLEGLVENLLDLARLEARPAGQSARKLSIPDLLRDLIARYQGFFAERRIALSAGEVDPSLCVLADPQRIERVLVVLLENAARHTPQGGEVRLLAAAEVQASRREVIFAVEDSGAGVPAALRDHIFERGFTTSRADAAKPRGSGLGLSIARRLVLAMNGRLWVDSSILGGASFRFTLAWPLGDGLSEDPRRLEARQEPQGPLRRA